MCLRDPDFHVQGGGHTEIGPDLPKKQKERLGRGQ